MRSAYRDPDALVVTVVRHPLRAETSLLIEHQDDGHTVVVWDDWCPVPELLIGEFLAEVVGVWCRTGPLAALAVARSHAGRRRRRG